MSELDRQWARLGQGAWDCQDALGEIARLSDERDERAVGEWARAARWVLLEEISDFAVRDPATLEMMFSPPADAEVAVPPPAPPPQAPTSVRRFLAMFVLDILGDIGLRTLQAAPQWWRRYNERSIMGRLPFVLGWVVSAGTRCARLVGGIPPPKLLTLEDLRAEDSWPPDLPTA